MDYMRIMSGITNTLEIAEKVLPLIKNGKEPLTKIINLINTHKPEIKPVTKAKKDSTKLISNDTNSTLSFFQ